MLPFHLSTERRDSWELNMVTQEKQSTEEETNKERKLAEVQLPE